MVGKYLDALSDEQRDRVIEAKEFGYGQRVDAEGRGCLVYVAEQNRNDVCIRFTTPHPHAWGVGPQFDALCDRFGKDRIVRLCKQRAGKRNRLHELRAGVYRELVPLGGMNGRYPDDLR